MAGLEQVIIKQDRLMLPIPFAISHPVSLPHFHTALLVPQDQHYVVRLALQRDEPIKALFESVASYACNPRNREMETGRPGVQGQP